MSPTQFIVLFRDGATRAAAVNAREIRWTECEFGHEASSADQARCIAESLRKANRGAEPILLALPSIMCLAARISLDGLSLRGRAAMAFRLEEQLPIAAEEFVCDFAAGDSEALGIAVPISAIKPLIDALQAEGVDVQSVTPFALLAAAESDHVDRVALVAESDSINSIEFRGGIAQRWSLMPSNVQSLQRCAASLAASRLESVGMADNLLRDAGFEHVHLASNSADERAARAAADIITGRSHAAIELRRDALAPRDRLATWRGGLNALLVAAAVMFLALSIAGLIRAERYTRAADSADAQLAADFHSVFPDWNASNIPAVIESEHRKLSVTTGARLPDEVKGSALRTLHDVIAAVPTGRSFSIQRMTFDDAMFELEGKAGSLGDVDALAGAARGTGMNVDPPQSRREEDGKWSFTIRGSKLPAPGSVAREGP